MSKISTFINKHFSLISDLKNNYDLKNIEICDYNLQNCKIKKINFQ